jgi:hypothetical protein
VFYTGKARRHVPKTPAASSAKIKKGLILSLDYRSTLVSEISDVRNYFPDSPLQVSIRCIPNIGDTQIDWS